MQEVNVLFDDVFDDVDIICVPDDVAKNISQVSNIFQNWMRNEENHHDYWVVNSKGQKVLNIETVPFVWWLNHHYLKNGERAYIVSQHGIYVPQYPTLYF